jgi:hypothetical protein
MDWVTIAALSIYGILLIAHFVFTRWTEKRIQYGFDAKIENLRAELRTKEAEISALREGVLSGRANRQALLDKRRLEAVTSGVLKLSKKFGQPLSRWGLLKRSQQLCRSSNMTQ